MLSVFIVVTLNIANATDLFTEDYEGETVGDDLDTLTDWTQNVGAADTVEFSSADAAESGSRSVILKNQTTEVEVERSYPTNSYTYGYTEVYVKPAAKSFSSGEVIDNLFLVQDGIYLTLKKSGSTGLLYTIDGDGPSPANSETEVDTNYSVSLDGNDLSTTWIHLVIKQEYSGSPAAPTVADLFLDGELQVINLGGESDYEDATGIVFVGHDSTDMYFDNLTVSDTQPLFQDTDDDSLPDAFEDLWGLNKNSASDRETDLDGDSDSNIAEYMAETPVNYAGSGNTSGEYFVNNLVGSSSYDGKAAYFTSGTEGPKDDLTDAIGEITTSGTINIFPGDGNGYTEGTISLGTKTITLVPQGTVTITP